MTEKWTCSHQIQSHCLYISLVLSIKDLAIFNMKQCLWTHVQTVGFLSISCQHHHEALKKKKSKHSGSGKTSKIQMYIYGMCLRLWMKPPYNLSYQISTVWNSCILRSRMKGSFNNCWWKLRHDHYTEKSLNWLKHLQRCKTFYKA